MAALLAAWFGPALVSAWLLLGQAGSPRSGVVLHAVLLAAVLLTIQLPFAAEILRGTVSRAQCRAIAALLASVQWTLLGFYFLSAVGHRYWGDWINLDLALAYAPHAPALLRTLGLPPVVTFVALLAVWLLTIAGYAALLRVLFAARARTDRVVGRGAGIALLLATIGSLALLYRHYWMHPDYWRLEPLRQAGIRAGFGAAGAGQFFTPERIEAERQAHARYPAVARAASPRPLVLIIVDALRSDQMGVYGMPVDNTPFLSALARTGRLQVVDNAYSVCTVSYCGILGTLSARYWHQITPQPLSLADVLKRHGYESRFILSGDHTTYYGIRRMFGPSVDVIRDGSDQSAHYNNDDRVVLQGLDELGWPRARPGFLYVHLMSVHRLGLVTEEFRRWNAQTAPAAGRFGQLDPHAHPGTRARYHNGILQADDTIRRIFARLEAAGVLKDAFVVITSDHGEFLGEMGHWSHGHAPFEPVVRIPLLVFDAHGGRLPPRPLVSQIDLAPTFLRAIGAAAPPIWSGEALQEPSSRQALVVESAQVSGVVGIVGNARFKYLRERQTGTEKLYALQSGDGEAVDLASRAGHAATLAALRAVHDRLTAFAPVRPEAPPMTSTVAAPGRDAVR
ncbi:MAG: sulfatase-like hydrolase/transferase [Burkholderiales bacterium]|nr:sulfatase-like hydrolase/transferase [Burkholderiales bacterium]